MEGEPIRLVGIRRPPAFHVTLKCPRRRPGLLAAVETAQQSERSSFWRTHGKPMNDGRLCVLSRVILLNESDLFVRARPNEEGCGAAGERERNAVHGEGFTHVLSGALLHDQVHSQSSLTEVRWHGRKRSGNTCTQTVSPPPWHDLANRQLP